MDFGNFKTPYGQKLYARFRLSPSANFEPMPLAPLVAAHAVVLQDMRSGIADDPHYTLTVEGQNLPLDEILKLFNKHADTLRLYVVRNQEDFFAQYGTKLGNVLAQHKQGLADGRRAFIYAGVFPIETINVRTEMHHPSYMNRSASSETLEIGLAKIFEYDKELYKIIRTRGPFLPPLSEDKTYRMIEEHAAYVDWMVNNGRLLGPEEDDGSAPPTLAN